MKFFQIALLAAAANAIALSKEGGEPKEPRGPKGGKGGERPEPTEDDLRALLEHFDGDDDGAVQADEARDILRALEVPESEAEEIIEETGRRLGRAPTHDEVIGCALRDECGQSGDEERRPREEDGERRPRQEDGEERPQPEELAAPKKRAPKAKQLGQPAKQQKKRPAKKLDEQAEQRPEGERPEGDRPEGERPEGGDERRPRPDGDDERRRPEGSDDEPRGPPRDGSGSERDSDDESSGDERRPRGPRREQGEEGEREERPAREEGERPAREAEELGQPKPRKQKKQPTQLGAKKTRKPKTLAAKKGGDQKGDWETEMADFLGKRDKDGSKTLSREEGQAVLRDVGFSDEVVAFALDEAERELKREPKIGEIVGFMDDIVRHFGRKHGKSEDEVAQWAVENVDPADVTVADLQDAAAYYDEEIAA